MQHVNGWRRGAWVAVAAVALVLGAAREPLAAAGAGAAQPGPATRPAAVPTIRAIEQNLEPAVITLHGESLTIDEIAEEFARQAGIIVDVAPDAMNQDLVQLVRPVHIEKQPFWAAVRALGEQADLVPRPDRPDGHSVPSTGPADFYLARQRGWASSPAAHAPTNTQGPVLFTIQSMSRGTTTYLAQPDQAQHAVTLMMSMIPDPRLGASFIPGSLAITHAVDNRGNSLLPAPAPASPPAAANSYIGRLDLRWPAGAGSRVRTLRGEARFIVPGERLDVTIDKPLEVGGVELGETHGLPFRIVIGETQQVRGDYHVLVSLSRGEADEPTWNRAKAEFARWTADLQLLDANGTRLPPLGERPDGGSGRTVVKLYFRRSLGSGGLLAGEPVQLKWTVPSKTSTLVAAFEFNDLPLP